MSTLFNFKDIRNSVEQAWLAKAQEATDKYKINNKVVNLYLDRDELDNFIKETFISFVKKYGKNYKSIDGFIKGVSSTIKKIQWADKKSILEAVKSFEELKAAEKKFKADLFYTFEMNEEGNNSNFILKKNGTVLQMITMNTEKYHGKKKYYDKLLIKYGYMKPKEEGPCAIKS